MKENLHYQDKSTSGVPLLKNAITHILEKYIYKLWKEGLKVIHLYSDLTVKNFNNIIT